MKQASQKPVAKTPAEQPTAVPWNLGWAILFVIGIFFVAQVIAALLIAIYPHLQGWSKMQSQDWLTDSVAGQFVFVLIAEALTIGGVVLFLRGYKTKLSVIGLKKPVWFDALYAIPVYVVYVFTFAAAVVLIKTFVTSLDVNQDQQIGFNSVHGALPMILTFVSLVILPPLTEEILIRGFLFTSLRKYIKFFGAAIITSLIFASAHLPEGGAAGPLYIAAIDTFILSMYLCYLREKTGSLWAGIMVHALKNGVAFLTLFVFASR